MKPASFSLYQRYLPAFFAMALFAIVPASAQTISFEFGEEKNQVDFTAMSDGQNVTSLGWSGGAAAVRQESRSKPGEPGAYVLGASGANKIISTSPVQASDDPFFTSSDTVYFSAVINLLDSNSSAVRVVAGDHQGANGAFRALVGFGAPDTGGVIGNLTIYDGNGWVTSSGSIIQSLRWYELTLVVHQNREDPTNSLGYLFYRNLATNGPMTLVEDPALYAIKIDLSKSGGLDTFNGWRFSDMRNGGQVGQISAGVGTLVIPEPSSVRMTGMAAAAFGSLYLLNQRRRKSVIDNR